MQEYVSIRGVLSFIVQSALDISKQLGHASVAKLTKEQNFSRTVFTGCVLQTRDVHGQKMTINANIICESSLSKMCSVLKREGWMLVFVNCGLKQNYEIVGITNCEITKYGDLLYNSHMILGSILTTLQDTVRSRYLNRRLKNVFFHIDKFLSFGPK